MTVSSTPYSNTRCPSCGKPTHRVVGPASQNKPFSNRVELHVLDVLRCRHCDYNEVQEDINTTADLDKIMKEARDAYRKSNPKSPKSPQSSGRDPLGYGSLSHLDPALFNDDGKGGSGL